MTDRPIDRPADREWHCDTALLERYTSGRTDSVLSSSIEAHVVRCATCRSTMAEVTNPADLAPSWRGVREAIQRPQLPLLIRLLRRCGLGERDAVLLSASRSLSGPWSVATIVVLGFAVWASVSASDRGLASYLLIAPLIPVLGVVAAFASADPTIELTTATPYSKIRLTLLRTLAVTATTVPLVVGMGLAVPGIGWLSVAWLGPAMFLTFTALVAMTWWTPEVSGAVVSFAWAVVVATAYAERDLAATVQLEAQLGYLVLAAVTAAALAARVRSARTPGGYA